MTQPDKAALCELCGEPMPPDEQMFKYHGYSGPCPKPPLLVTQPDKAALADRLRGWCQDYDGTQMPRDASPLDLDAADKIDALRHSADGMREIDCLQTENWQLRQACGYPIPADKETPQNPFKCGICDAEALRADGMRELAKHYGKAMDALYKIKEEIAFGKEERLNDAAELLKLLDDLYLIAATATYVDLRVAAPQAKEKP